MPLLFHPTLRPADHHLGRKEEYKGGKKISKCKSPTPDSDHIFRANSLGVSIYHPDVDRFLRFSKKWIPVNINLLPIHPLTYPLTERRKRGDSLTGYREKLRSSIESASTKPACYKNNDRHMSRPFKASGPTKKDMHIFSTEN